MKGEIVRKSIHVMGLTYIPLYLYFGREVLIYLLFTGLIAFLFFDFLRFRGTISYPEFVLRKYEYQDFGGHVYFVAGSLLATILFPGEIAMASILFLTVGDGVSGMVKRLLSPIAGFWMGFLACVLAGMILRFFIIPLPVIVLISGAIVSAFLDYRPIKMGRRHLNDNFMIPVIAGFVMVGISIILGKF